MDNTTRHPHAQEGAAPSDAASPLAQATETLGNAGKAMADAAKQSGEWVRSNASSAGSSLAGGASAAAHGAFAAASSAAGAAAHLSGDIYHSIDPAAIYKHLQEQFEKFDPASYWESLTPEQKEAAIIAVCTAGAGAIGYFLTRIVGHEKSKRHQVELDAIQHAMSSLLLEPDVTARKKKVLAIVLQIARLVFHVVKASKP